MKSGTTRRADGLMKGPRGAPQVMKGAEAPPWPHNFLNIPPIALRSDPKIAHLRNFCTNTTWYPHYHLTCERLRHSPTTVSFILNPAVHAGRPPHIPTP